jgi:aspartate kinase
MKPIVVMKFGGSCFVDSAAFEKIKDITNLYENERKIYVASALKGITNLLVEVTKKADAHDPQGVLDTIKKIEKQHTLSINDIFEDNSAIKDEAKKYIRNLLKDLHTTVLEIEEFGLEPYFSDYILAFGEKMSTYLLHLYLKKEGFNAFYSTGEELIITDDNFTNALPNFKLTFNRFQDRIAPLLESRVDDTIFCITGFIGRNKMGYTTTLGRGGSDFTATIMARAVFETCHTKDVKVILWKDVDGILTTNPKYVEKPKLVHSLNYSEAKEMAFFGAKILHPKCLAAIEGQKIKVEIKNFDKPKENTNFSIISEDSQEGDLKGISTIEEMSMINVTSGTLVNVPGVLGTIFTIMGENGISVSMVAQSSSEVNTTFVVEKSDGPKAVDILKSHPKLQDWFTIQRQDVGIIAVIGDQIHKSHAKIFNALSKAKIEPMAVAQSSDGLNVSIVIPTERIGEAVQSINDEFHSK